MRAAPADRVTPASPPTDRTPDPRVRVLTAAHLYRLDHGDFPTSIEQLQPLLDGALPRDPFRQGEPPLTLRREGDELRCYSWGANGQDDGGDERKDVSLTTSVPAADRAQ